jgi:undecaprenyl-diphosphatase
MIKNSTTIFPQFYINEQFSYPSGHTSRAVFIAIVVWLLAKKRRNVGIALLAWVGLIALGRIYLGSHWLSDVIGGGLLGCGLGLLTLLV